MIHKVILYIAILFCLSSCVTNKDLGLSFDSYLVDANRIYVVLSSKLDLNSMYYSQEDNQPVSKYLYFPLIDGNFDIENMEKESIIISGTDMTLRLLPIDSDGGIFKYRFFITVEENDHNTPVAVEDLEKALKEITYLRGKLVIFEQMTHSIHSNDVFLPAQELLELYKLVNIK